ncbi:MAG: oligosaccharide flippase family protein, partial [Chlamydiota bacterium]|nr:oligosaccharide flippase family protein [Chlamydiota bacterium]
MHRLESEREHKDSLVKTIARYSSSNIYRRLLGILNVLIKPKLLSPELYGLWNLINVIPRYAAYFHLGTHETIRYAIPYHEARNETEINADIIGSVYYGTFFLYCFVALGVFLFAILRDLTLQVRIGLLTMSVVIILLGYVNYYTCLLKAYQKFKIITTANYIYATISVFSGLILIYFFSIYGAYLTLVLCEIAAILYLRGKMPLPKHNKFKMHVFIPLVKKGFFIIAFGLCITLTRTCDRFIISYFLGYEQLGY